MCIAHLSASSAAKQLSWNYTFNLRFYNYIAPLTNQIKTSPFDKSKSGIISSFFIYFFYIKNGIWNVVLQIFSTVNTVYVTIVSGELKARYLCESLFSFFMIGM